MQITGIILAGGQSSRMGTDKAMLQINGKALLEKAIEICRPVCHEILISSNNSDHENFGYIIIPDEIKNCGPIGGIFSCLKKSETNWNFVISVDSAFVTEDFVQFLISETGVFDAVVPIHENGKEPLVAVYHKSCVPAILEQLKLKDYKMHHLLNVLNTKFTNADSWVKKYPAIFKNLNRPEDFIL
jgi:molybdopterin-guanine dinucleotide biosynthesis protein A